MRYVVFPSTHTPRPLPFYLAAEEYLARGGAHGAVSAHDCFFMWRVPPTVIFGRCQNALSEVNIPYCRAHGIHFFRRKSGGGCVYADMDNIMMSYITSSASPVARTFSSYTEMIARALRSLGLEARASGRNDITLCGEKVSGNAFYHTPEASIVHGTMLYDTDIAHMATAITPAHAKLNANGVASVPSRITTLSRHISLSLKEFMDYMRRDMCQGPDLQLTTHDLCEIERIAQPYYTPEWIFGLHRDAATVTRKRHIPGVGQLELQLCIDSKRRIHRANLTGDFFLLSDIDQSLLSRLTGVEDSRNAVELALASVDTSATIRNLTTPDFLQLFPSIP